MLLRHLISAYSCYRWWKCSQNINQLHTGKEGHATRAFEVTVCRRKCVSVTRGFYGSYNDKTIVKFDDFVRKVHKGRYSNLSYSLYDQWGEKYLCKGLYLLCDNGYHKWRCMQCPLKYAVNYANENEVAWSEMVESLRKDVECFFGVLKIRFLILRYGIRVQNASAVDDIFQTCCNYLIGMTGTMVFPKQFLVTKMKIEMMMMTLSWINNQ